MKESLAKISTNLIFRETFSSESETRANGGVPSNVVYNNGIATFNGTSSIIDYSSGLKFPRTGSVRIRFRINDGIPTITNTLISKYNTVGNNREINLNIVSADGKLRLNTSSDGTSGAGFSATLSTSAILPDGNQTKFSEIIVTYTLGGQALFYLNGVSVAKDSTAVASSFFNSTAVFTIGARRDASALEFFSGDMELVEIYNTVLTATEVSLLYNNRLYKPSVRELLRASNVWAHYDYLETSTLTLGSGNAVSQWRSKSSNANNLTDIWLSNFSSGVDGVTGTGCSVAAPNIPNIGGYTDYLKITIDNNNGSHSIIKSNVYAINSIYSVSYYVYIPSTNSVVNSFGSTSLNIKNTWQLFENKSLTRTATDQTLSLLDLNGNSVFQGNGTDVVYIRAWNTRKLSGNHLVQNTAASQPIWQSDGVKFNGTSNFLKTAADLNLKQPVTIYAVLKQNSWADITYIFDGNATNSFTLYQRIASPNIRFTSGGVNFIDNNTSNIGLSEIYVLIANSINSEISVNNKVRSIGNIGNATPGGFTLGSTIIGTSHSSITVKEIIIIAGTHTTREQNEIKKYLAKRHSIKL